MSELDRLRESVRKDLAELRDPQKSRCASTIGSHYGRQGYALPRNHIEDIVRSVAKEFGCNIL